ncbi:GIY-YIG nuclease family protein [Roseomonas sp. USHLN139]|uniref:GIY-YIG nuclease family protein n=1 Tax=Roseomonas sp. USHLN139 TaxID=3081298 RepID=UPI003B01FED3
MAAWKERKVVGGVYRLHCAATGESWVGHWPDLATVRNRLAFTLDRGTHPDPGLQRAWAARGGAAFAFEVLEAVEEGEGPLARRPREERAAAWREQLRAGRL